MATGAKQATNGDNMQKHNKNELSTLWELVILPFSILSAGIYLIASLIAGKWLLPKSGDRVTGAVTNSGMNQLKKTQVKTKGADLARRKKRPKLTMKAAEFLTRYKVSLRNSNTKQVISRHMGENSFPDTHGIGVDYAVPLWTIGILGLEKGDSSRLDNDPVNQKLKEQISRQKGLFWERWKDSRPHLLSDELLSAARVEQDEHLDAFAVRIKMHLDGYSPFGYWSPISTYNFEVLLGEGDIEIDEIAIYSTGGRCKGHFDKNSLMYRATLSDSDISFVKRVLSGEFDHMIDEVITKQLVSLGNDVAITLRHALCEEFCKDILLSKIIMWANARGDNHLALNRKVVFHVLTNDRLRGLLEESLASKRDELNEVSCRRYVGFSVHLDKRYQEVDKWSEVQACRREKLQTGCPKALSSSERLTF